MTRADRKNAVLRKTRFKFQQQIFISKLILTRNYEALSKTSYSIFSIYCTFEFSKKKISIFSTQVTLIQYLHECIVLCIYRFQLRKMKSTRKIK